MNHIIIFLNLQVLERSEALQHLETPHVNLVMQRFFLPACTIPAIVLAALVEHARALSVSDRLACAVESDTGRLRCWGNSGFIPLPPNFENFSYYGPGEFGDLKVPTDLHENTVDVVVLDSSYVCALKGAAPEATEGKLICFVAGNETTKISDFFFRGPQDTPPSLDNTNFVQLSGKGKHFCALRKDGYFSCWSTNEISMGAGTWDGAVGSSWADAKGKEFKFIAVGYDHMCAIHKCDAGWECFGPDTLMTRMTAADVAANFDNPNPYEADSYKIPAMYNHTASTSDAQALMAMELKYITCGKGVRGQK